MKHACHNSYFIAPTFTAVLRWDFSHKNVSRRAYGMSLNSSRRARSSKVIHFFRSLKIHQKTQEVSVAERSVRDLRHVPRYHEPLQYNHQEESIREERRQSSSQPSASLSSMSKGDECTEASGKSSLKRRVTFEESVVVVPVPLRSDYPEWMLTKLWSNAVERCDNVGKWYPFTLE